MRHLPTLLLTLLIIGGCGPSAKEKEDTAIITCNILSETKDGSVRIKEMNSAREKIQADRYLSTDKEIKESLEYGLCKELVLNDPSYITKLEEAKKEEQERIQERRDNAWKETLKKINENAEKIKRLDEKRKKEEAERRARFDLMIKEADLAQDKLREAVLSRLKDFKFKPNPFNHRFMEGNSWNRYRSLTFPSEGLERLYGNVVIRYKDTKVHDKSDFSYGNDHEDGKISLRVYPTDETFSFLQNKRNIKKHIVQIELHLYGIDWRSDMDLKDFPPLSFQESAYQRPIFNKPIVFIWKNEQ